MTTVSTYVRVSRLEEPLFRRRLSAGRAPEPTTTHRLDVASDTKPQKKQQSALLLKGIGEDYTLVTDHDIPAVSHKDEILVKVLMQLDCIECSNDSRSWLSD